MISSGFCSRRLLTASSDVANMFGKDVAADVVVVVAFAAADVAVVAVCGFCAVVKRRMNLSLSRREHGLKEEDSREVCLYEPYFRRHRCCAFHCHHRC